MMKDYSTINYQNFSGRTLENNNKKEEDFLMDEFRNSDFLEDIGIEKIGDKSEKDEKLIINKHLANLNL
jgi:hypothetical protein